MSTFAILPHYFKDKLSLANGFMNLGGAIVQIIIPVLIARCLHYFVLRVTWIVCGLLFAITVLCGFTFQPVLDGTNWKKPMKTLKNSFGIEILRNDKFIVWSLGCFIGIAGNMIPILNINHYSLSLFPNDPSEILNVCFAITSGISALFTGKIGDRVVVLFNYNFLFLFF
jgi:nitrate/nitrite transporter NarK